ncbi:U32 family peptidase [Schaalia sp. Marseille-Q2122]|uniref:peptidase U32 family protein n=1 Tax=Schaalia sp. Marseille-Q2122 TaxID=2736604 RepID=UPI001C37A50F|nr:U32 family peptidase [Schaalia sp. Marseille-Q2122]
MSLEFPPITRRLKPEVLAPAGNLATVKTAIDFGADAVYCGGKAFGMRSAPQNLSLEDFEEAVAYAHARDARIFVTCNILPTNDEIDAMNSYMGQLGEIGVDALIVSDIGVLMAARRVAPHVEVHVSTQAGITNYQAANAFAALGASRVVLARELDIEAIRGIRAHVPDDLEIEAFVHGSMCMAFSGRCLISQHLTGRDANHGDCAQSCRWKYHVVEEKRPGQFIPVEVTDGGTFLFNSHDMNVLAHVDEILDAGVTSLKIEGRAKSAYYVAAMANAYKTAVNEFMIQRGFEDEAGRPLRPFTSAAQPSSAQGGSAVTLPEWLLAEPDKVTHREYSTGFYYPEQPAGENIMVGGYINEWRWVGDVLGYDEANARLHIYAKNKISPGMDIEFLFPGHAPIVLRVPDQGLLDEAGEPVAEINHPAHEFSLPCDQAIPRGAMIRARLRARTLPVSAAS